MLLSASILMKSAERETCRERTLVLIFDSCVWYTHAVNSYLRNIHRKYAKRHQQRKNVISEHFVVLNEIRYVSYFRKLLKQFELQSISFH